MSLVRKRKKRLVLETSGITHSVTTCTCCEECKSLCIYIACSKDCHRDWLCGTKSLSLTSSLGEISKILNGNQSRIVSEHCVSSLAESGPSTMKPYTTRWRLTVARIVYEWIHFATWYRELYTDQICDTSRKVVAYPNSTPWIVTVGEIIIRQG